MMEIAWIVLVIGGLVLLIETVDAVVTQFGRKDR